MAGRALRPYHGQMNPAPLPDWLLILDAQLAKLPPVPAGHTRLFRIQSAQPIAPPAWIAHLQAQDGTQAAAGRWFTADPAALAFYAQELDAPVLHTLEVPIAEAEACKINALPHLLSENCRPRVFSRDMEQEHFVPRNWLNQAQVWPLTSSTVPRPRRWRP